MIERSSPGTLALLTILLAAVTVSTTARGQALYLEGVHYERIDEPVAAATGVDGQVLVLEFFSYGCSHCKAFEPFVTAWKAELPPHVMFRPVPAGLGRALFQQLAAIHYVADELGVLDAAHPALFEEIQDKGNRRIVTPDGLATFFGRFGVAPDAVTAALASPTVQERFAAGEALSRAVGLPGVPMVVVDGRYRVMRNGEVTSYEQMLDVIDFLVERRAREGAGQAGATAQR